MPQADWLDDKLMFGLGITYMYSRLKYGNEYYESNQNYGHRAVTFEKDGQAIGFAYFAPAAMTDRTWYLYWIAVSKQITRQVFSSPLPACN